MLGQECLLCISIVWFQNLGILFGYSTRSHHSMVWWVAVLALRHYSQALHDMVSCHCFILVERIVFVTGCCDRTVVGPPLYLFFCTLSVGIRYPHIVQEAHLPLSQPVRA